VAVRALVPGSTIEVKSAAGRAVIGGSGTKDRYSIAADGTEIADRDSDVPLKLVTDAGVRIVPPAEKSLARKSRPLPEDPSETEIALLAADDFESVSEPLDYLCTPVPRSCVGVGFHPVADRPGSGSVECGINI